jgi:sugar lactone lactonase YvrE
MRAISVYACELAFQIKCQLGEGPVWDAVTRSLYWVDIEQSRIHRWFPRSGEHSILPVGSMVGAVALCTNGKLMAALQSGLVTIDPATGQTMPVADPEKHLPGNRYNDGKCDPAGRFWIGSMSLKEEPGAGNLYMIGSDWSHVHQLGKLGISNGLAWTADKKTMYFIDTPARKVWAFDYDNERGSIRNRRVVITVPEKEGYPDGMTIDQEDMLWIAHWDGWQVARWNPYTGRKMATIPVPAARVTCCTFGGEQLTDLYVTTATTGLNAQQLSAQPLAGSVFVAKDTGFSGMEAVRFNSKSPSY